MAAIPSNMRTSCHAQSISLPSTSDQLPLFNENFYRFQASQEATTSCSSSSFVGPKLNGLNDMYEAIEMLLTLPTTQRSLGQGCHKQQLNELLDELLELLDLCSTIKDALSMSMDSAKELQSVLRRKRGDKNMLTPSVNEYLSQRGTVKKAIHKALSGLKKQGSSSTKQNHVTTSNVNALKEMGLNTFTVFKYLLTYIFGSNSQSKSKRGSSVSNLVCYKRVRCDQSHEKSEVKKVDDELNAIIGNKKTKSGSLDVEIMQKGLAELELILLDLDEQLEALSSHLIKTRVSILNILNY